MVDITIKKPISFWLKALKFEVKSLFKAGAKCVKDGVLGKWEDFAVDVVEVATTAGLETKVEERAWALIFNSISRALFKLIQEQKDSLNTPSDDAINTFYISLEERLENTDISINESLFKYPKSFELLPVIQEEIVKWLLIYGYGETQAKTLANRLPSYFVVSLDEEWASKNKYYDLLYDRLDLPTTPAVLQEKKWDEYNRKLDFQLDESVFGEPFGLRQIYVPLNAYYIINDKKEKRDKLSEKEEINDKKETRFVVELEDTLTEWIKHTPSDDAIRLISGGPGSGKSTFAKIFANKTANELHIPTLFIPLHLIDYNNDLCDAVNKYLKEVHDFNFDPFNNNNNTNPLFLIFDGLDELSLQGQVGLDAAKKFGIEIDRTVRRRNDDGKKLKIRVLICGRDLAIQSTETEFRKEGTILHTLPYFLSDSEKNGVDWKDEKKYLNIDKRDVWWRQYGNLLGNKYDGLPDVIKNKGEKLDDITSQPLLNYLIALSFKRGKIDFDQDVSRNVIYADLILGVYERKYQNIHVSAKPFTSEQFERIMEEIAIATFHGDGRTTTVSEIRGQFESSNLKGLLKQFEDEAEKGVTQLLTSFYFKRFGMSKDGEATHEFTHKSFREYLTAKRIVREIELLYQAYKENYNNEDECLLKWGKISAQTAIDLDLFVFIKNEIALKPKQDVIELQTFIIILINKMLRIGIPIHQLNVCTNFNSMIQQSRNAEEALFAILNACAINTENVSEINWPEHTSAGEWIRRLQGQRPDEKNKLILYCLSYTNFDNQYLVILDLYNSDLKYSSLINCSLVFTTLHSANLQGAQLREAQLRGANLQFVYLERANLERANLERANLQRAHLLRAHLLRANLQRANLEGANLKEANLQRANLQGANLEGANLEGANLLEANLQGANLEGANLLEANLQGADLQGANIKSTILEKNKRKIK